jgi:crotonobetainyl-CoA:carnitine CoA-transferase CaiB-like acyl-CoA transferase
MGNGSEEAAANLPLSGLRLFEIGSSVAAPYGAWLLAALGADVIKVERPGKGDDARQWGEMFPDGRVSVYESLNRDKRGVTVDYKDPEQCNRLRELIIESGDVVLQNMRPGQVERYGLDAATLRKAKPSLIYCNIWAYGSTGPMRDKPGYDPLMQAYGGLMSTTGEKGRAPVRVGTSIIDMGTGMWCALGILAALQKRNQTGEGTVIDSSLYETALGWMTYHAIGQQASGRDPSRQGSGAPGMVPYQVYPCADGYLMIAAPNDKLFALLCQELGHPEWKDDPRFVTNQDRYANVDALNELIESRTRTETREYWQNKFDAVGLPSAPEQVTSEMLADPQTEALGILQQIAGEPFKLMGMPLSFDGERPPLRAMAPSLGQHNKEIFGGDE